MTTTGDRIRAGRLNGTPSVFIVFIMSLGVFVYSIFSRATQLPRDVDALQYSGFSDVTAGGFPREHFRLQLVTRGWKHNVYGRPSAERVRGTTVVIPVITSIGREKNNMRRRKNTQDVLLYRKTFSAFLGILGAKKLLFSPKYIIGRK